MNEKEIINQKEIWGKTRAKGKLRFILINGILIWGLFTAIGSYILEYSYTYFYNYTDFQNLSSNFIFHLSLRLVIFSLAGCLIYWLLWIRRERWFSQNSPFEAK